MSKNKFTRSFEWYNNSRQVFNWQKVNLKSNDCLLFWCFQVFDFLYFLFGTIFKIALLSANRNEFNNWYAKLDTTPEL